MNRIIGICDTHNEPQLGELTAKRPFGSVSFLGRYGLIDFALSNFSNSNIDRILVLVKSGVVALKRHVRSGAIWTHNTRLGYVDLLVNEKGLRNPATNTDINNLKANVPLDEVEFDYAVIAPTYFLSSMDFRPIIEVHKKSNADITVVYTHTNEADKEYLRMDKLTLNGSKVEKTRKNLGRTKEANISLDTYIVSKKVLKKLMSDSEKISDLFSIKDMIRFYIEEQELDVRGYAFLGYVVPVLSYEDYVNHSFALLNYHIRSKLFLEDWPIYTTTHNTPPALYGKDADVQNSFVANGAIIKGKVRNSIISRDVVIEKGADINNCIIFTQTNVGENAKLKYVLADKSVNIHNVKTLSGEEDDVIYIKQGAKI